MKRPFYSQLAKLAGALCATTVLMGLPALAAPNDFANQQFAQDDHRGKDGGKAGPQGGGKAGPAPQAQAPAAKTRAPRAPRGGKTRPAAQTQAQPQQAAAPARTRGKSAKPAIAHGPKDFAKPAFQRNVTASRRFHIGVYHQPPQWVYRRWVYGEVLPRPYWDQTYWISDFWDYDLDRPPEGCEWTRNGPDALLVDTNSGEVLEAVYNVFY